MPLDSFWRSRHKLGVSSLGGFVAITCIVMSCPRAEMVGACLEELGPFLTFHLAGCIVGRVGPQRCESPGPESLPWLQGFQGWVLLC